MSITKTGNQDPQINSSTNESFFDVCEKNNDQLVTTTSAAKKTILVALRDDKKNNSVWEAVPMMLDKYGRERVDGMRIDSLYRQFEGRPMALLKNIDVGNKLDTLPIVIQEKSYNRKYGETKAMMYRDSGGKYILLISRCGFFDKVTYATYDDLIEGIQHIFGGENNVEANYQDIVMYRDKPANQKQYTKNVESSVPMHIDWEGLDIEAKKKSLQGWGISLNFYGEKEIIDEKSKKTFTMRVKDDDQGVLESINSLDETAIQKILLHPNIQKLRTAGVEIPVGRLEEILTLDEHTIDKIIKITNNIYPYYGPYNYDFAYLASLDDTSIYKASKLRIAGISIHVMDIAKCGELPENVILDAIKSDKVQKLASMGVKVSNIPEDVQILASIHVLIHMQDFVDKVKTITRNGFHTTLREIKSLIYMNNMTPFVTMKKNIGKNKNILKEIQETRDVNKIETFKEHMRKETDITLSIIDDVTKILEQNDSIITKQSDSSSGYESKILNDILKKFVYPRIGDMDGEVQKTIVLTVAGYIGDCFRIEQFMQSPEYKDTPEKLLCGVRGIDTGCITGKVTMEREGGSIVFYIEDELDYMKVHESQEDISLEDGTYKDKEGNTLSVSGGFSTSYSKIHQLVNTITVVNGSKEKIESPDTKKHELRHSLDNRLMIAGPEDFVTKCVKKEILAYMTQGYSQEKIQKILSNPAGLYTYFMDTNSKERESHTKKVTKYIQNAFKAKESGRDRYINRLAITPITRWSSI